MPCARPLTLAAAVAVALTPLIVANTASSAEPVTCHGRRATIVGTDSKDNLVGTPGPDVIQGRKGFDTINGRGGNDLICGGKGADDLAGGRGADRLFGGTGGYAGDDEGSGVWFGNTVTGGPGNDFVSGGPDHDVHWPEGGSTPDRVDFPEATGPITVRHDGTVSGPGIGTDTVAPDVELVVGTPYADTMTTVGPRTNLRGDAGSDSLRVTKGLVDIDLRGGSGDDRLDGRLGAKWMNLYGGTDDDVLLGSPGGDYTISGTGNDTVDLGNGGDDVYGLRSPGISGIDTVTTGAGNDRVDVSPSGSGSTVDLGPGRDTLGSYWKTGALRVDAVAGTYEIDDAGVDFRGAERYVFAGSGYLDYDVTFVGSDRPESVRMGDPYVRDVTFRLGGGDDFIRLWYSSPQSTHVFGAAGNDEITGSWTDDDLVGGVGDDTIDGLRGTDHCVAEHVTNCES
jgi:Ca2+-binding RTX toxin-like protein